jgi:hypothetical protein
VYAKRKTTVTKRNPNLLCHQELKVSDRVQEPYRHFLSLCQQPKNNDIVQQYQTDSLQLNYIPLKRTCVIHKRE